jgi:hypothetical protein
MCRYCGRLLLSRRIITLRGDHGGAGDRAYAQLEALEPEMREGGMVYKCLAKARLADAAQTVFESSKETWCEAAGAYAVALFGRDLCATRAIGNKPASRLIMLR